MPRTAATGAPLLPTTTRFDATCGDLKGKEYNGQTRHAMKLIQAAKLWPTPRASCGTGASDPPNRQGSPDLQSAVRMWPTPAARDHKGKGRKGKLPNAVRMFPSPTTGAGMCGGTGNYNQLKALEAAGEITEEERRSMASGSGGQLNPEWVEWLMGFPPGWTDLNASEMP